MRAILIAGLLAAGAGPALAHPHVWIDAGVEIILNDQNEATGVRISWTYDDLYSLYVVGDMGLDPDWDGKLTPEEEARRRRRPNFGFSPSLGSLFSSAFSEASSDDDSDTGVEDS